MKKVIIIVGLSVYFCGVMAAVASLNEWTFEQDAADLRLSQSTNAGTDLAVFAVGGAGFLETDGAGNLLSIHTGGGTNGMWTSGAVLDANVTDISSGVHYLRYDLSYDLKDSRHEGGTVLGLSVVDSSGTNIVGIGLTCDWGGTRPPEGRRVDTVLTGLYRIGRISAIVKVDLSSQTMAVWYDLTGANSFDENNPATNNVSITGSAIRRK